MGVGHLDIGQGVGGAQVFGSNPAIQTYANILQQQKVKRDADNKYLADTLAQAKPEGLRNDADRASFFKKYQDLKTQGIAAENEPDKFKKAMALANVRQGVMDLNSYVDESKKQAAKENSFTQQYMANPTAWSDQSIDQHRKSTNLAVDDPNVVKDYTTLARQPDLVKLDNRLKHVRDNELLSGIQGEDMITGRQKVGNKMVNTIQTKYTADPADVAHAYLNEFDINPDFQHHLVSQYGHAIPPGLSPQDQKAALVGAYVKDLGEVSKYGPVKDKPDAAPDRFYDHEEWLIKHGLKTPDGQLTPAQSLITGMQQGQPGTGEKLISLAPKGQYGNTNKPHIDIDQVGNHIFKFPDQIDQKALEYNQAIKKKWDKENPGEPFDPTDKDYKLKQVVIKPAKIYTLNPASNTYLADAAQMATEQNINLSHLNQIESKKGGRGQIPQAIQGVQNSNAYQHTQTAKDPNSGKVYTLGYKNGKWYDTKTNKEWGQ